MIEPLRAMQVIFAWEPHPPVGESPVDWSLITTEPIETIAQVQQVVTWYRTRWLIEEKLFTIVAAEADWPDAYRANRFVRGAGPDPTAIDALANFRHFPRHDRQPPAAVQRYEKPQRTKPL